LNCTVVPLFVALFMAVSYGEKGAEFLLSFCRALPPRLRYLCFHQLFYSVQTIADHRGYRHAVKVERAKPLTFY
jgi:hypothetical protein